ncbi:MAG: phosphonopyruvate decarboxylase [Kiloniellaceae bacterium]
MIRADAFLREAGHRGFDFYSGVPCSFLTPMINRVIGDRGTDYVGAASEGEAVAIAAGAWLAGRGTVVMCQNSGLGNVVNPVTSLNWPFRIPTLLVVTWRGRPGLRDEPQHELMGRVMARLLDDMAVRHRAFPKAEADIAAALDAAEAAMRDSGLPYAFIMEKGSVAEEGLDRPEVPARPRGRARDLRGGGERPARFAALERLLAGVPDSAAIIATTGKCGRELFTLADRAQHLYQVGSMGCASAMGLGVALNVGRPVVVLDGDGAALMKLGTWATIGSEAPPNLIHILLDNGVHDSTGGQATAAANVDFPRLALACGYRGAAGCDGLDGFEDALREALGAPGPHLVHLRIKPGSIAKLGRPTVKPAEVARRFRDFLCGGV